MSKHAMFFSNARLADASVYRFTARQAHAKSSVEKSRLKYQTAGDLIRMNWSKLGKSTIQAINITVRPAYLSP